ncbi:MAG: hypothetical protein NTX49_07770 [Chlamydiae bacterium]|nr:hypothetical protein [Chlamydiota bacterium]
MSVHPVTMRPVEGCLQLPEASFKSRSAALFRTLHDTTGSMSPLFTGAASSAQDVDGDTSYVLRQTCDLTGQLLSLPGADINVPPTLNVGATGQSSALFSAVGISTSFNVVMGAIAAKNAYNRMQQARQEGSDIHQVTSGIDIVRGTAQGAGGLAYIPYRFCSMATSILGVDASGFTAPSALGAATYSLGYVGNSLFGIFYACIGLLSLSNVIRLCDFRAKIWKEGDPSLVNDVGNVTKIITFLKDRLVVTPKTTLEQLQKAHLSDPAKIKAELKEAAKGAICRSMEETLKEAVKQKVPGAVLLSKEEIRSRAEEQLGQLESFSLQEGSTVLEDLSATMGIDPGLALTFTELLGLDCMTALRGSKQESELSDSIGPQAISLLKKALDTSLLERLSSKGVILERALEEAASIIKEVRSQIKWNLCTNIGLFVAGVLGTVATVLSLIPAALMGVAETIAMGTLWLACALTMLPVDVGSLFSAQNSEGPIGKYDKALICISSLVGVASLIVTSVLASIFSMGTVPIAIGIVIGVLWFLNNAYSFYRLDQKQKKYEMDHPTLTSFAKNLQRELERSFTVQEFISIMKRGENLRPEEIKALNAEVACLIMKRCKNLSSEDKKALKIEVARRAGIEKPLERQSLLGRHGLILPDVSQGTHEPQNEALQKELEDRLQNAPLVTLRILAEMDPADGLRELCQAVKEGNRESTLRIFRGLAPEVKTLVDKKIALVYGFGEMYFDQHTASADVLRSVEKAYLENKGSMSLRALYDHLAIMAQRSPSIELTLQAKELFRSLSVEEISLVTINIYHKRAKKESSRHFASVKLEDMQVALETVKEERAELESKARRDAIAARLSAYLLGNHNDIYP